MALKGMCGLLLMGVLLGGCGEDEAIEVNDEVEAEAPITEDVAVEETEEEKQRKAQEEAEQALKKEIEKIITDMKTLVESRDVKSIAELVNEAKSIEAVNDEMISISDNLINELIEERDFLFLKENFEEIVVINSISTKFKNAFSDFLRTETNLKLDEMDAALRNFDYTKVEDMYMNEPVLYKNEESSAMYHYSLYEQSTPSFISSLNLGLAVKQTYSGRWKDEIYASVTDESYRGDITQLSPISEREWKDIEFLESVYNDLVEANEKVLKKEAEELEYAKGKNPQIGMSREQVEVSLWGLPLEVNRTVTEYSVHEQWIYGNNQYLYFTDGILTGFQD